MTEKELKKLNRYQLLEIIIMQTEELNKLKAQLERTTSLLEQQQMKVSQAGNIALASLTLSGIFETAQSAADLYLEKIKEYTDNADEIIANAHKEAEDIILQARQTAAEMQSVQRTEE